MDQDRYLSDLLQIGNEFPSDIARAQNEVAYQLGGIVGALIECVGILRQEILSLRDRVDVLENEKANEAN